MTTHVFDTVIVDAQEWGIMSALGARKASPDARIAIVCSGETLGGMTGGSLGYLDISGAAMLENVHAGAWGRFIYRAARDMGLPDTRLTIPSMAERAFIRMLARANIKVFLNEQLKTATLDGDSMSAQRKITSIEMMSGTIFQAKSFYDATLCCDLSQAAGDEGVHWALGSESADHYGEADGGYQASITSTGSAYLGDTNTLDVLAMGDPGLTPGQAYPGVQAYAHRVIYAGAAPGRWTRFAQAQIKRPDGVTVPITDDYDPDQFVFYGILRAGDRDRAINEMTGGGRGALFNDLYQDNDDIPLRGDDGYPAHWSYPRFDKANPAATYAYRPALEYRSKKFTMQSRVYMATDSRYSGAWQDSCRPVTGIFGWSQREHRRNNGIASQYYARVGGRPINDQVLSQDNLTVESQAAAKSIWQAKPILLAGFPLDAHLSAIAPLAGSRTEYIKIGMLPVGHATTSTRGYSVPIEACFNSSRPNLITIPACSALAMSSLRMAQNLALAGYAMGLCNGQLLADVHPANIDYAALRTNLIAEGFTLDPLA